MAELKQMLKDVVGRFKKINEADLEAAKRMQRQQAAARKVSKEVKAEKG